MKIDFTWWSWKDSVAAAIYASSAVYLFVGLLKRDTLTGFYPFNGEIWNPFVKIITLSIVSFLPVFFTAVAVVYCLVRAGSWTLRQVAFLSTRCLH